MQYTYRISRYCHTMTFRQVSTLRDYYKYSFFPLDIVQWTPFHNTLHACKDLRSLRPQSASCNNPAHRFPCFYLILAISYYFNLSSVFILHLKLICIFDLFLSYTNRRCTNLPRMSARAYVSRDRQIDKRYVYTCSIVCIYIYVNDLMVKNKISAAG